MMPEIPKSARELLARQTAPEVHPSPDLLNAYAEQTLGGAEKDQVMEHLAACSDCREVVFVASQAQEEEVELPLVARVARAQQRLAVMPAAAMPASAQAPKAAELRPAPRRNWWKWAAPLAAVIVLGAVGLVEYDRRGATPSPPATQVAMSRAPESVAPAAAESTPAPPTPEAKKIEAQPRPNALVLQTAPAKDKQTSAEALDAMKQYEAELARRERHETAESLMRSDMASNLEKPRAAAAAPAPQAKAAAPPAVGTLPDLTASASTPNGGNDLTYIQPQSLAKSALGGSSAAGAIANLDVSRRSAAAGTHWRVSDDGHLEHSVGPSTWTRVLSAEPVVFRVVSTVGNNVWAGGNGGELWHSSDGGQHWNRATLSETAAITTIHFDSAQQGSLATDAGTTWTTSDGGQTWSKQ
jgi:hypothetical protein